MDNAQMKYILYAVKKTYRKMYAVSLNKLIFYIKMLCLHGKHY